MKKRLIVLGFLIFGLSHAVAIASDNEMWRQMSKGMTIKAHLDLALRSPRTQENIKFLEDQVMVIDVDYMLSRLDKPEDRIISNTLERIKCLLVVKYGYSRSDFYSDRLSPAKSTAESPFSISESPSTVSSSDGSGKHSFKLPRIAFSPIGAIKKKP